MKHTLIALASAMAFASAANAGTSDYTSSYSSSSSPASSPLYQWFAGASVGWLTDNDEEYYTLHFGTRFAESGPMSHSVFVETGYTEFDSAFSDTEIVPLTLNYKLDYAFNDRFSAFVGGGLGVAFLDISTPGIGSDDSTQLTAQVFAGVGYSVTPALDLYTAARWVWVDDAKFDGFSHDAEDDIGLELGFRVKF